MWQPEDGWERLPGGGSPSSGGVWRAPGGRVVQRLLAPAPGDPPDLDLARDPAYWRRPADVAREQLVADTPGLRGPRVLDVVEDAEGVVLVTEEVAARPPTGLHAARALGLFAGAVLPERPWLARGQQRARVRRVEQRGGWTTLARTTAADVADHLWSRRGVLLDRLDALPQVPQHGDPVPANLRAVEGPDRLVALDWATLGHGPVGGDLGYWSLSTREDFEPLLAAYVDGLPFGTATLEEARLGAQVVAVLTVLSRADWALARVARGEGPLAAKFRHPAVAPHLRALQRQLPQVEALLGTAR